VDPYFRDQVRQRLAAPGNDLISRLVAAEVDGRALDEIEASDFALSLLLAGHVTTTTLLGSVRLEARVAVEELVGGFDRLTVDQDPGRPHGGLQPFAQIAYGTRRLPVLAVP
jgi:hypothetical protein